MQGPPESDRKALHAAMLSAFPSWNKLERLVDYEVGGRNLESIAGRGPLDDVVYALLKGAVAGGWFGDLEAAVIRTGAGNSEVAEYAKTHRKSVARDTPTTQDIGTELERIVRSDLSFLDVRAWTLGLLRAQRTVCRIDVSGSERGTGFLVARDLVLTNHHVISDVLGTDGRSVALHFDFHSIPIDPSRAVTLARSWLVASSPPSPLDTQPLSSRGGAEPGVDTLDFALLRLARPAGDDEVGGSFRGFLQPEVIPSAYRVDAPIAILQHPKGRPQQVALDTKGIVAVNAARTRMRYRTNTEPGSSGSPCFDLAWRLVGLHHSGEPGFQAAGWNEGIPIETIFANLSAEASAALVASRQPAATPPSAPAVSTNHEANATTSTPTNRELREALARIFSSPSRIRMLLQDAGVTTSRISFEQSPLVIWDTALAEVREANLLDRVISVAREEYPNNTTLADIARRLGL